MRKKLLTVQDGKPAIKKHTKPCSDCPFRRDALPGWLAGSTPDEWLLMAHGPGETRFECHVKLGQRCAGSAIYRANCLKRIRRPDVLVLPPDRTAVFATPIEFKAHHESGSGVKQ